MSGQFGSVIHHIFRTTPSKRNDHYLKTDLIDTLHALVSLLANSSAFLVIELKGSPDSIMTGLAQGWKNKSPYQTTRVYVRQTPVPGHALFGWKLVKNNQGQ